MSSPNHQHILSSVHLSFQFDQSNIIVESSLDKISPDEDLLNSSRLLMLLTALPVMISYHELDVPGIYPKFGLENLSTRKCGLYPLTQCAAVTMNLFEMMEPPQ